MESARSSVAELLLAAVGGDRTAVVGAREAECQVVDEDVHLEFLRGRWVRHVLWVDASLHT